METSILFLDMRSFLDDLQAVDKPFGSCGHEAETDCKHYDTNPLIDLGFTIFEFEDLVLQRIGCVRRFSQVERVFLSRWVVQIDSGADVPRKY